MDQIQQAKDLRDAGLFRDALACVDRITAETPEKVAVQILRAEMLERVGRPREAELLAKRLLGTRGLSWSDKSTCDFVLARVAIDRHDFDGAAAHLTKSISCAQRAGDFDRTCAAQLKLLLLLADGAGADATGPLLSEARTNATKSGNPRTMAAVHVYFAQIEGLRSSVLASRRHIRLALHLLETAPNAWLEAVLANLELSLALMDSDFRAATEHAEVGLAFSERSGSALEFGVNRSNAGYAFQILGEFEAAERCYERALEIFVPGGEAFKGTLDSLARIRLAQNRLAECEQILNEIELVSAKKQQGPTYVYRHVQFTRAELLVRKGDRSGAMRQLNVVLRMARDAGDSILTSLALIELAHLHLKGGRCDQALNTIQEIATFLPSQAANVFAKYQELLGSLADRSSSVELSNDFLLRASRIYAGLQHREALLRLNDACPAIETQIHDSHEVALSVLQSATAVLAYFRHSEFVALELAATLAITGQFETVAAISTTVDGHEHILNKIGTWPISKDSEATRLSINQSATETIQIVLVPRDALRAQPTIHAISSLIRNALELKNARDERNERATPWPADELPTCDSARVLSGHMREVMTFAQRVARTKVNVLITGESGTGKEILARAIHEFSDRAHKPFVPFNCSAVPRDLLESQLFGHRRGAFTGAERDHLGLIRSAADGTLFLDEVGDMSLDLQPKLLRFLESGEIAPLGETAPINVNVRVVAATNANLEDAVRDGKFREDLFYRLNVVRLSLKPLRERRDEIPGMVNHFVAAAAREHKKGHLQVSEDTMERLLLYRWPGNVRQLQNEVRRMVALAEANSTIEPDAISPSILEAMPNLRRTGINGREIAIPLHDKLLPTLSRIEYEMIKAALREHQGRLEPAAKSLGISRKGLYLKRQRLGL